MQLIERARIELEELLEFLADEVGKELTRQGHKLTGKLIRSLAPKLDAGNKLSGAVLWERYGEAINRGVSRTRIPYAPGSGARHSKYIEALERYVKLRGLTPKPGQTHRNIAFAIAQKHKQTGLPTVASRKYSQTGRRTGAVEEALERSKADIQTGVEDVVLALIEDVVFGALEAVASSRFIVVT